MTRPDYDQYLQGIHWRSLRIRKLAAQNKCEQCGFKYELQIHHKTYENFGEESLDDLVVLCARCHTDRHTGCRWVQKWQMGYNQQRQIEEERIL